jgi:hypothetical protein
MPSLRDFGTKKSGSVSITISSLRDSGVHIVEDQRTERGEDLESKHQQLTNCGILADDYAQVPAKRSSNYMIALGTRRLSGHGSTYVIVTRTSFSMMPSAMA